MIIGGGIAGASAGYELSRHGSVIILEKEPYAGYHSTGRSSAIFQKSYLKGDPLLNILVSASEDFLRHPPQGFTPHPLLSPRDLIYIADAENQHSLDELRLKLANINISADFIDGAEAARLLPILSPPYRGRALLEKGAADMDVNALHDGYLRAIKAHGGRIITEAEVTTLHKKNHQWQAETSQGNFQAPIVVNAAGAWGDQIARLANITPINIQPLRRTVIMVALPKTLSPAQWPLVMNPAEGYYFKPDSGKILMTPGDEKPSPPTDAQPEEIDIAYAAHYLEKTTTLKVNKIARSWAGLRNHVADGHPVLGFDPESEGFFWLAGQGGFGIKTAPALGRIAAALIRQKALPQDISDLGLTEKQISIHRLK